jgi:hypothetical protein
VFSLLLRDDIRIFFRARSQPSGLSVPSVKYGLVPFNEFEGLLIIFCLLFIRQTGLLIYKPKTLWSSSANLSTLW